ncbi:CopG family transcriptional regulator [Rhizobium leguminosarum bv. trifolii]|uniref:type II toxin-antitoxin system ParD family antitoxin n=1 Tax=Rhizobium leguminosarum TaxID=384 RepID=UPI000E2F6D27|nr:type II toxin-antitoxin system ParD family antitoxin [Rhizobium leguminosarum]RFB96714.1 CopG family transcriptional regulator [Rhizobium leguminosarum bv. trifolii]
MPNVALGKHPEEFARRQEKAARERWLNQEISARYDELMNTPGLGIPAETVRTRFETKRRKDAMKAR